MRSVLLERAWCPRHPSAFLLPPLGTATPAQLQASPRAGRAHTALICRFKARGGDPAPRGAAEAPLCSEGRGAGRELPGAVPGHTYAGHMPPSPPGEPLTCTALHPPLTCVARAFPRPCLFALGVLVATEQSGLNWQSRTAGSWQSIFGGCGAGRWRFEGSRVGRAVGDAQTSTETRLRVPGSLALRRHLLFKRTSKGATSVHFLLPSAEVPPVRDMPTGAVACGAVCPCGGCGLCPIVND